MMQSIRPIILDKELSSTKILLDAEQSKRMIELGLPFFYKDHRKLLSSRAEIMKYKLGKRVVLHYFWQVQEPHGAIRDMSVLGKIYDSNRGAKIYNRITVIQNYLEDRQIPFIFPRAIGYLPHGRVLFQEYVKGDDLSDLLCHGRGEEQVKETARVLRRLHSLELTLDHSRDINMELEQLESILCLLPQDYNSLKLQLKDLVNTVKLTKSHSSPTPHTIIHRDFYYRQILFTNTGANLIDLDEVCMGEPELDIGNFLAHLRLLSLELYNHPDSLETHRQRFLTNYQSVALKPVNTERIELYETLTSIRLACILIFKGKPVQWIDGILESNHFN